MLLTVKDFRKKTIKENQRAARTYRRVLLCVTPSLFSLQGWGRAAAATYLVGFVILVICFALAVIAFSIEILRFNFVRGIGGLLFVVGKAGHKDKVVLDMKQASAEKHARWSLPYKIGRLCLIYDSFSWGTREG